MLGLIVGTGFAYIVVEGEAGYSRVITRRKACLIKWISDAPGFSACMATTLEVHYARHVLGHIVVGGST